MSNLEDVTICGEEWREVAGFGGRYLVSSLGRVYSNPRLVKRGGTRGDMRISGRILAPRMVNGYDVKALQIDGEYKASPVHNLVLKAFVGKRPDRARPRHSDGDRANNNLSNLFWEEPPCLVAGKRTYYNKPETNA